MVGYTHEVFRVTAPGQPTIRYYNIRTKITYTLDGEVYNPHWGPNEIWKIRPIIIDLENK